MWCKLNLLGKIPTSTLQHLSQFFQSEENGQCNELSASQEDWNNENWDEKSSRDPSPDQKEERLKNGWMSGCLIATTQNLDYVVLARSQRFVILELPFKIRNKGAFKSEDKLLKAEVELAPTEDIISVLCIPVTPGSRSGKSSIDYDWTCVLVGTSTGLIRFYDAYSGRLVWKQQFAPTGTPVSSMSVEKAVSGGLQVGMVYGTELFVHLDGLALFAALKAAWSQVMTKNASPDKLQDLIPVSYQKWRVKDSEGGSCHGRRDMLSLSSASPSFIQRLESASIDGGFKAYLSPGSPSYNVLMSCGNQPFLSWHWINQAGTPMDIKEMVHSLKDRMKSAVGDHMPSLGGWVGDWIGRGAQSGIARPEDARPTDMQYRYGMSDYVRKGERITLLPEPGSRLALVTDDQARVCLVDTRKGQILRIWKGYRDAQCGWIRVTGSQDSKDSREKLTDAFFVVIYARRRGLMEIWTAQLGPRVAAFNVDRGGNLLQLSPWALGASETVESGSSSAQKGLVFLDSNGGVFNIDVPFHMALQDESNQQRHDSAILQELKHLLVEPECDGENVLKAIGCLKTVVGLHNVVRLIVSTELCSLDVKLMDKILEMCSDLVNSRFGPGYEMKRVFGECEGYRRVINAYAIAAKFHRDAPLSAQSDQVAPNLTDLFQLEPDRLQLYLDDLERNAEIHASINSLPENKHNFAPEQFHLRDMLRCLTVAPSGRIKLAEEAEASDLYGLGQFLYGPFLRGTDAHLFSAELVPILLLEQASYARLFALTWLLRPHSYSVFPPALFGLLEAIDLVEGESGESEFWLSMLQQEILKTTNSAEALTLALALRSRKYHGAKEKAKGLDEYDVVQVDQERWDVLVSLLHCLLLVNNLVTALRPKVTTALGDAVAEPLPVSAADWLATGKGWLFEQIAKSIVRGRVGAEVLLRAYADPPSVLERLEQGDWVPCFRKLLDKFPICISCDYFLVNCAWEAASLWAASRDGVQFLRDSIHYASDISNPVLQHGTFYMIWHSYVASVFKETISLVEKVGKFPKDRLCKKELGLSEHRLSELCFLFADMLKHLYEANAQYIAVTPPVFVYEDFLDNFFKFFSLESSSVAAQLPLAQIAFRQKCTNYHLVRHHWQLAVVLMLMLAESLKPARPLSLFDTKGYNAFFVSLFSHPLLPTNVDLESSVHAARRKFLQRYASAIIERATECEPNASKLDLQWLFVLADEWAIDPDALYTHVIIELYLTDQDLDAERMMHKVSNKAALGAELLMLAGERVKVALTQTDNASNDALTTLVTPTLSTWLRSMDSERQKSAQFSAEAITRLLDYANTCLPATHAEHNLVTQLTALAHNLT